MANTRIRMDELQLAGWTTTCEELRYLYANVKIAATKNPTSLALREVGSLATKASQPFLRWANLHEVN